MPKDANTTPSQLPGLSSELLWNGILSSSAAGDAITNISDSQTAPSYDDTSEYPQILHVFDEGLSSAASFVDMSRFQAAVGNLWATMNAQFAEMYLKDPAQVRVSGSVGTTQSRLVLRQVSFWLLETCLILLTCCTAGLAVTTVLSPLPTDCVTLAGLSLVLANSSDFVRRLTGTGTHSEKTLEKKLEPYKFSTMLKPGDDRRDLSFVINSIVSTDEHRQPKPSAKLTWFQPIPATIAYRVTLPFLLLVAIIACLKVLYSRSTHHGGIASVTSDSDYAHLARTYIPTLIMVGIAALVSMLHFNAAALQPYMLLRRNPSIAYRSITKNYLGTASFAIAARQGHFGLVLAFVCSFAAGFLTIAVSGLYTAQFIPTKSPISLSRIDAFQTQSSPGAQFALETELVVYTNLSYPQYTFDHLALAKPGGLPEAHGNNGSIVLRIPGLLGRLNCTDIAADIQQAKYVSVPKTAGETIPGVAINLRRRNTMCDTFVDFTRSFLAGTSGAMQVSYSAGWYVDRNGTRNVTIPAYECPGDRPCNPNATKYFGYLFRHGLPHTASCLRSIVAFGKTSNGVVGNATVLTCRPYVESLYSDATITLPDLRIDPSRPPVPDMTSSVPYKFDLCNLNGTTCTADDPLKGIAQESFGNVSVANNFDGFFSALVYGQRGISASELYGKDNAQRLNDGAEHLWGIALAQYLNNFRTPASSNEPNITGTVTTARERLVQIELSSRLLDALLRLILFCMLASFPLLRMKEVLLKNPCSIAAATSLVAGSDFLSSIPRNASSMSVDQAEAKGIFRGYMLSLGWWSDGTVTGGKRFGIDVGKAEE